MATIDYKEKYEQALEVAQRFYNNSVAITKKGLEDIFPELKESRDKMIRQLLISFVKYDMPDNYSDDFSKEDCLAWLENQGEQKQELLTKEKALKSSPFVEQKSAEWSEDDQSNFCELRSFIVETYRAEDASKLITWLESLKDRVQPQPKQEWSEEDEQTFIKSVEALEDFGKFELADWLKEHKNQFLKPQNTWKPSDLPHWKKSTLPNDNTTGFNSNYFCYKGYSINYKELFEKLPKDD